MATESEAASKHQGDGLYPEEEVLEGDWTCPQVDLKEVEVITGEEEEEIFWTHRAKLFRWAKDTSVWKERGLGDAKLLKHKTSGKIRFLLRQEKTLKIVANHYVFKHGTFCELKPNVSSDKIWVWSVYDYAEEAPRVEQFALKFGQVEAAQAFKDKFNEAIKINSELFKPEGGSQTAAATASSTTHEEKDSTSKQKCIAINSTTNDDTTTTTTQKDSQTEKGKKSL